MKRLLILLLFLTILVNYTFGQADTAKLIKEVNTRLSSQNIGSSAILSNASYDILHPQTSFRELIKKYPATGVLTITNDKEPGKKIKVNVSVKDKNGKPVGNALVYLYQTDSRGWYAADAPHVLSYEGDTRHARLFGYANTGKTGTFELHTVKPSGYPQSELPAHIHVHITAEGYRPYVTEFLFDDDERLKGQIRDQSMRSKFLIAKPETGSSPFAQEFSYSVTLERG
jgi:protocatechuate 3,4-dioxygenase beta subunit